MRAATGSRKDTLAASPEVGGECRAAHPLRPVADDECGRNAPAPVAHEGERLQEDVGTLGATDLADEHEVAGVGRAPDRHEVVRAEAVWRDGRRYAGTRHARRERLGLVATGEDECVGHPRKHALQRACETAVGSARIEAEGAAVRCVNAGYA